MMPFMKRSILFLLTLTCFTGHVAFSQTGEATFKKMHERFTGKWQKTFTFLQTTEFYLNDSLRRSETWYEAANYPYYFRVDFGDLGKGNAVIYHKDSAYRFENGSLKATDGNVNPFNFILGGMYHVPLQEALATFKKQGYDLSKGHHTTNWDGRPAFVLGANAGDSLSKQLWVDAEHLYVVYSSEVNSTNNNRTTARWMDHVKVGNGWSETKVVIYINGALRLIEKYYDLQANPALDDKLYEPDQFGKWHWFKN
jgi:hypothetical protein